MQFGETEITGWDAGCGERYGGAKAALALPEKQI